MYKHCVSLQKWFIAGGSGKHHWVVTTDPDPYSVGWRCSHCIYTSTDSCLARRCSASMGNIQITVNYTFYRADRSNDESSNQQKGLCSFSIEPKYSSTIVSYNLSI
ncbi:hypothetical protein PPL_04928 [Heterostelium album PN500]|uniref:Uncharacterized protein n=1 Tax=Heterostelium pallidum (strain ATCC 26659 / Pp 5 / PN500) TaxID=670386 RepID=D3B8Y4_HETP5|nr:hypothetical protein PPL_04928 [Heterostelium album PN500]EFA82023.1 hypothetical protein PPL_04928 [Heterostelium album PN500]|eukprot:XP_020434140.1 hypothetical protein PPL_04928 [Heterostelium album PN500]